MAKCNSYIFDMERIDDIAGKTEVAELESMLAESAISVGNAALRVVRALSGENPVPISAATASDKLVEAFTRFMLISDVLGLTVSNDMYKKLLNEWYHHVCVTEVKENAVQVWQVKQDTRYILDLSDPFDFYDEFQFVESNRERRKV